MMMRVTQFNSKLFKWAKACYPTLKQFICLTGVVLLLTGGIICIIIGSWIILPLIIIYLAWEFR